MKKVFQKEWFGIQFVNLKTKLSLTEIASDDFYKKFYDEFNIRYNSFDQLSEKWKMSKNEITHHLLTFFDSNSRILSVGSGICFIENELLNTYDRLQIVALEPNILHYFNDLNPNIILINDYFPSGIEGKYNYKNFDFVYSSGIDYVFDNKQYIKFYKSFIDFGFNELLITEVFLHKRNFLKDITHKVLYSLSLLNLYNLGQFWGYFRTLPEHLKLLKFCGYKKFDFGFYNHGACWIKASI